MTGQVFVLPTGTTRDRHVHLVFPLADDRELMIRDVRKFARVALYRRDEAGRALGVDEDADVFDQLGPEPLDPSFTLPVFRKLIRGRRARLKPLLVDQAFLAGVGNIYADESLWLSKLHPLRSAAGLSPADERALYTHAAGGAHGGHRATRLVDRRLHGPRGRRRDAGSPPGLPADRPALLPVRPAHQALRAGHPGHPFLLLVPATAEGRADARQPRVAQDGAIDDRPPRHPLERAAAGSGGVGARGAGRRAAGTSARKQR